MNSKDRLLIYVNHTGLSKRAFEMQASLPNGYMKNVRSITESATEKISRAFPDLSIGWLMSGEGEMLKEQAKNVFNVQGSTVQYSHNSPYSVQVAGGGEQQVNDSTPRTIPLVPTELCHKPNVDVYTELSNIKMNGVELLPRFPVFSDYTFYYRVMDDSMEPEYKSGDVLAIRAMEPDEPIINGSLYILNIKRSGLIFRILKDRGEEYECIAIGNGQRYENFRVPKDDVYRLYKVKGMFRICI